MKDRRGTSLRDRITNPTRLGRAVRLYRQVRERTIRDVAKEVGIAAATMYRIEIGEAIDATTMLKVWQWLLGTDIARARARGRE